VAQVETGDALREPLAQLSAVLPALQRGAVTPTPNGRLVSESRGGRRTQSPPESRAGAERCPYQKPIRDHAARRS
jgi:hypothetical protein